LNRLGNGHINFDKFWQLAKQVTEVVAWQQITCPFPKVQTVLTALQTAPVFGESGKELRTYRNCMLNADLGGVDHLILT